jgi:hypothetical protein
MGGIRWTDVFSLSFWGCALLILYSLIPLLTILAGIFTLSEGLVFWGLAMIVLGVMALIGPFYAVSRSKAAEGKPIEKASDG